MANDIYQNYPPSLTEEQRDGLVQTVKDWSIQHGLTVRPNPSFVSEEHNPNHVLATNAPVTLFPSPFPKACFEQARSLQQTYNELYARIASDEAWLEETMSELFQVDDFLGQLWKIHLSVKKEGYVQDLSLGLFRSDYMLHTPADASSPSLKQVEFNTISSSFGGLSALVSAMHTELNSFPDLASPVAYPPHPLFNRTGSASDTTAKITTTGIPPVNTAVETLVSGLAAAHSAYGSSRSTLPLCIIFLVQDNERNVFDQYALSSHLHSHHKIPSFRLPASKILALTSIPDTSTNPQRPLIYTPPSSPKTPYEVSVVYFRALYSPDEYTSPSSWAARHHLERSGAIKCPSILLHLSGSKKVQQVLTTTAPAPTPLDRFLPSTSPSTLADLRSTFAPQYSLSPSTTGDTDEGIKLALDPKSAINHVLKPQREGGGNNIYKHAIPGFLKAMPEAHYKQYVLMELIQPPEEAKNVVLRSDGAVVSGNVVSELGIFGTCLWKTASDGADLQILQNNEGGYLMRTKGKESDEGGVAAGFSSLDSLVLYE